MAEKRNYKNLVGGTHFGYVPLSQPCWMQEATTKTLRQICARGGIRERCN
jgi:hypothetical protein